MLTFVRSITIEKKKIIYKNMMKQLLRLGSVVLATVVGFSSCMKDGDYFDPTEQYQIEKPIIEEYVKSTDGLEDAKLDTNTGIWYKVIKKGERVEGQENPYEIQEYKGREAIVAAAVVKYEGRLVSDGTVFEKTTKTEGDSIALQLDLYSGDRNFILAWMVAFFPKTLEIDGKDNDFGIIFEDGLNTGDEIRIVTPSGYAYGNRSQGKIPANSPLDFKIEVLSAEKFDLNPDEDGDNNGDDDENDDGNE